MTTERIGQLLEYTQNRDSKNQEDLLRTQITQELISSGWSFDKSKNELLPPDSCTKDELRLLHNAQRIERTESQKSIIAKYGISVLNEFAEGGEINPSTFSPELVKVNSGSWESIVFRFSTLLWSVPVSQGYGRRMRYMIRDHSNGKWVGLFALGDPVFNLRVRDQDIGWNQADRRERLYHVMDAYVLGSIPPYNQLLSGKLIALAVASNEIRNDFSIKYTGRTTIIQQKEKEASLVLITTTSALGRSSIYNRLKLPDENNSVFQSVGYSRGWGHFHISNRSFNLLREWLKEKGDPYADGHQYGDGPNWRFRTIRRALDLLGFNGDLLRHGIEREVFLIPLATNYREILKGGDISPNYFDRNFESIVDHFKNRWMIPRSMRMDNWRSWTRKDTWNMIVNNNNLPSNFIKF